MILRISVAGSPLKTAEPETRIWAPASTISGAVSTVIPPSTSTDVGHLLEAPDFFDHLGNEVLASKAGVYAHYVHVADVGQRPLYKLGRGRRVQSDAGLATAGPDQIERAVQVRGHFGLNGDADDPGLDEGWDQAVRVRYLEVGVNGKVYGGGKRGCDGRPYGKVRDEVVVHSVEVY